VCLYSPVGRSISYKVRVIKKEIGGMIRAQTQAQALSHHSYNPGSEETYKNDSPRNNV